MADNQASLPLNTKPTLRTKYQFIHFEQASKTAWRCVNNRSHDSLGLVRYYGPWKQWIYMPEHQTIYSAGCLADIQAFIAALAGRNDAG